MVPLIILYIYRHFVYTMCTCCCAAMFKVRLWRACLLLHSQSVLTGGFLLWRQHIGGAGRPSKTIGLCFGTVRNHCLRGGGLTIAVVVTTIITTVSLLVPLDGPSNAFLKRYLRSVSQQVCRLAHVRTRVGDIPGLIRQNLDLRRSVRVFLHQINKFLE